MQVWDKNNKNKDKTGGIQPLWPVSTHLEKEKWILYFLSNCSFQEAFTLKITLC
jgi:hypothetical protein